MPSLDWEILVLIVGETERGWRCERESGGGPFILPKHKSVSWLETPKLGARVPVVIPHWLALNHRQIVGDAEFERHKRDK